MKKLIFVFALAFLFSGLALAQAAKPKPVEPSKFEAEIGLAKLAVEAHGGDKLRNMKTLVMRGSADVVTSAFNQKIPTTFVVVIARDRYRFEINNPFQPLKQVYNGVDTSTTIRGGMTLPPITRLGFPLLPMVGQPGFVITALPESKKKKKGFRMTSPEGYYTDFYLDEKTNQIKGYDSSYDINGRQVTTSVVIDKLRVIDGVSIPEAYAQRIDTEQITIYAEFKTKDIEINTEIADDVFSLGN